MKDKIGELLEELAAKLGVTIDHLWAVLVAQAQNQRIAWIAEALFLMAVSLLFAVALKGFIKRTVDDDWDDHLGAWIAFGLSGLFVFVWWGFTIANIDLLLATFNNPEYVALKNVLGMLKGS